MTGTSTSGTPAASTAKNVPEKASVVVIGGGVIGTSIAYHLARSGVEDVVLLEKGELGCGSTCRAAGGVRASFSNAANIEIGLRGLEVYSDFTARYAQDIDFHRDGYLYLLSDQDMVDVFDESVAVQNAHGVPSLMIDPGEAQMMSPLISTDGMLAASWSPDDGKCTPEAVVQGYARAARRHGATLVRNCAVIDVTMTGDLVSAVVTDHGVISTGQVVVAAGAWSRQIGEMMGIDIPVTPYRRQIAFTEPIEDLPPSPSLTIDFPSTLYFHPEGDGLLLGWSDPDQPPGFDLRFELDEWLLGLGEIAQTRLPSALDYGIATGWAGLYEVTPDQNQIIDRTGVDGVYVAAGYSGHGFLMGPATGEIITDLFHDREPGYDISAFRLDRFAVDTPRGETNIV